MPTPLDSYCSATRFARRWKDGADEYWFLRGPEPYKARFADQDPGLETMVVPHGLRGRVALKAIRHLLT